jgi:hypothetical protein
MCESITVQGQTCPAGYSTNSNCAEAAGGSCDVATYCGGPCQSTEDCPNDHICQNDRCVLLECTQGIACTEDLCQVLEEQPPLPDTALFDEDNTRLIIGITLLVSAFVATQVDFAKLDFNVKGFNKLAGIASNKHISRKRKSRFSRSRDVFEKKFLKKK